MSLDQNPPPHWDRFKSAIKRRKPPMPNVNAPRDDEERESRNRMIGIVQTALDGLNVSLPDAVGHLVNAGTASDLLSFVQATVEGELLKRTGQGTIVGGGVALVRGGHQNLQRNDEMLEYLLGMSGYIATLGRMCTAAIMRPVPYTTMPLPVVPEHVSRSGSLFSGTRQQMFLAGYNRVQDVMREVDNLRPPPGEDYYSKRCLSHIAADCGFTSVSPERAAEARRSFERKISSEILGNDLQADRRVLRHWALS